MPTTHRNLPRIIKGPNVDAGFVGGIDEGKTRGLDGSVAFERRKAGFQCLSEGHTAVDRPPLNQALRRVFRGSHCPVSPRSSEVKLNRLIPNLGHFALLYATVASQWSASRLVPRVVKESRRAA